jgi:glycosyl-4,4'-diaponeurosporenoate acyltransferase
MPLVHLRPRARVAVNVAAWAAIHALTGYAVHRLPVRALERDSWLLRLRPVEQDGRLYVDRLGIRRWKDRVPEAGALFPGGVSKRQLPVDGGLARFAVETRRAELGHWLALAAAPMFGLWNTPPVTAVMVVYGAATNLPCIAIQRYNRIRVTRALRSRASRSDRAARARSGRGTTGRSMP